MVRISVLERDAILAQLPEGSKDVRILERVDGPLRKDTLKPSNAARVKYIGLDGQEKEEVYSMEYC